MGHILHKPMALTQQIGSRGEKRAVEYLIENGYSILHTNWRSGRYELDIVAQKDCTVHFVEVKCRRKGALTAPEDAITPAKFRALQRAAEAYIEKYEIDSEVQFDAIAVDYGETGEEIRYIPAAMTASW